MVKHWAKRFRNIILMGMPGSGKSSFGKTYAWHSGRAFLDFDVWLESQLNRTIPQIFQEEGEAAFRAHEERLLRKLERRNGFVIAMGGGTLCNPNSLRFAKNLGLLVWLNADPAVLAQRLWADKSTPQGAMKRPLFTGCQTLPELEEKVRSLSEQRAPYYVHADLTLNSTWSSLDALHFELALYEKRTQHRDFQRDMQSLQNDMEKWGVTWDPEPEMPQVALPVSLPALQDAAPHTEASLGSVENSVENPSSLSLDPPSAASPEAAQGTLAAPEPPPPVLAEPPTAPPREREPWRKSRGAHTHSHEARHGKEPSHSNHRPSTPQTPRPHRGTERPSAPHPTSGAAAPSRPEAQRAFRPQHPRESHRSPLPQGAPPSAPHVPHPSPAPKAPTTGAQGNTPAATQHQPRRHNLARQPRNPSGQGPKS